MFGNQRATFCLASVLLLGPAGAISAQVPPIKFTGGIQRAPEAIRINLLAEPEVQEDLNLDKEQRAKAMSVVEQLRSLVKNPLSPEELRKSPKEQDLLLQDRLDANVQEVTKLLNKDQSERLDQIALQVRIPESLFLDEHVAMELKLTDQQRQQLLKAYDEMAVKDGKIEFGPERGQKLTELRKEWTENSLAVLSDEQRALFEKMQGNKITLQRGAGVNFQRSRRRR